MEKEEGWELRIITIVLCSKKLVAEVIAIHCIRDGREILDTICGSPETIWFIFRDIQTLPRMSFIQFSVFTLDSGLFHNVREMTYFQSESQAICLARMFHCLVLVSPYVVFSSMVSPESAPNSTYTRMINYEISGNFGSLDISLW